MHRQLYTYLQESFHLQKYTVQCDSSQTARYMVNNDINKVSPYLTSISSWKTCGAPMGRNKLELIASNGVHISHVI